MQTFNEIYAEEHSKAIHYARRFFSGAEGKNNDVADQIVTDAFVNLHATMKSGRQILTPTAWLCSAIQTLRADFIRRSLRGKRSGHRVSMPLLSDALAIDDRGFEAVDDADSFRFVWARLTEAERTIAKMVFMQGMHQTAVAKQLGVSRRTVERQVHQVRQRLRSLLSIP